MTLKVCRGYRKYLTAPRHLVAAVAFVLMIASAMSRIYYSLGLAGGGANRIPKGDCRVAGGVMRIFVFESLSSAYSPKSRRFPGVEMVPLIPKMAANFMPFDPS